MNDIINKFLLAGDKLMPEMHLKKPESTYHVDHLIKTRKKYQNLKKQEMQNILTEMNWIKLVFSIWLTEILKISKKNRC